VNVETKEQLKQWIHTHSPNKPKMFKQTSARKLIDGNCFLRQERSADGGIMQQQTTIMSEVYCETLKKNCIGPLRTKGVECSSMIVRVCIQLLTLEYCRSISTGSCLTIFLTALISLQVTTTCLPT
jgi:hypothetical protein